MADRVLAVSEATARDVIRLAGVPGDRIRVVPKGVSAVFPPREGAEQRLDERWGLEPPFLLYVGALDVRKDPRAFVVAWRAAQADAAGCGLVIAGEAAAQVGPTDPGAFATELWAATRKLFQVPFYRSSQPAPWWIRSPVGATETPK